MYKNWPASKPIPGLQRHTEPGSSREINNQETAGYGYLAFVVHRRFTRAWKSAFKHVAGGLFNIRLMESDVHVGLETSRTVDEGGRPVRMMWVSATLIACVVVFVSKIPQSATIVSGLQRSDAQAGPIIQYFQSSFSSLVLFAATRVPLRIFLRDVPNHSPVFLWAQVMPHTNNTVVCLFRPRCFKQSGQ